jgi:hypothetical protein
MVRRFDQNVVCSKCGKYTTAESGFERWLRNYPPLVQNQSIARFDLDVLLHRYMMDNGARDIQAMFFIEVKTNNSEMTPSQHDTLMMFDQLLRYDMPRSVFSTFRQRDITLWGFGAHFLTLEGLEVKDDERMTWDDKYDITIDQLAALLEFELHPDNPLEALDLRKHNDQLANTPQRPAEADAVGDGRG